MGAGATAPTLAVPTPVASSAAGFTSLSTDPGVGAPASLQQGDCECAILLDLDSHLT